MYWRALGFGAVAIAIGVAAAAAARMPARPPPVVASAPPAPPPSTAPSVPPYVPRVLPEITASERRHGHHACNPPDRLGLGPYRPYVFVGAGRLAIPQRGGMTADHGYDVLIHFHGSDPMRKLVAQVARGVAYVAVDKGLGSGPYTDAFLQPEVWQRLKHSINAELQHQTHDPAAHVRHFALSSWSAGYGAVVQILKQDPDSVDAVILLDSLHATYRPEVPEYRRGRLSAIDTRVIAPVIDFARRAASGEKLFVLTHSHIDPVKYPSVERSADALLAQLELTRQPASGRVGDLEQESAVDVKGLHVWGFSGRNEMTHCGHLELMARALADVVERAWLTPEMDRDVPNTPAPLLGGAATPPARRRAPLLERVPPSPAATADAARRRGTPAPRRD